MQESQIIFPPDFHVGQCRRVFALAKQLVEFRGFNRVCLDFTNTYTAFAEAIIPVILMCKHWALDGVKFELKLPRSEKMRKLFLNCGWAHAMSPNSFEASEKEIAGNLPFTLFENQTQHDALVNSGVEKLLKRMLYLNRSDIRAFEWSINEICDNVLNHAESAIGGAFQLNIRPQQKEVEFIVADFGCGIPNSLRSMQIRNKDWSDSFALEQSIKQGVTRDPEFGQGNGLFGTYQIAARSGGTFHINSGFAHLVHTRGGEFHVRLDNEEFFGTSVVCAISFGKPAALEEALSFKGENHHIVDMLELKYETDSGDIMFDLRKEAVSLGSRYAGLEVRKKILNLLRLLPGSRIVFDLRNIGIMSSSFADEVFGKLVIELGLQEFNARIRLKDSTSTLRLLISKAVDQRLGRLEGVAGITI